MLIARISNLLKTFQTKQEFAKGVYEQIKRYKRTWGVRKKSCFIPFIYVYHQTRTLAYLERKSM